MLAGFAVVAGTAALLPQHANAFWPFSSNVRAAVNVPAPSASTPVLAAAINIDPNPDKGLVETVETTGDTALIAYSGPSGTIADVVKLPPSDRISVYVVRPGDTLSEIAGMFGVSANTILWANNLKSRADVHPGDTLLILPVSGVEHTVVRGDTLKSLAKKYSADAGEIAQYNGFDAAAALVVGSAIIIPGGEIAAPAPAARRPGSSGRAIYEPYLGGGGADLGSYFMWPVGGGIITQGLHGWNGIDIGAAKGTPIYAAASGTVIIVRNNGGWNGGYGNYVVVTHPNGTQSLYGHMTSAIVAPGASVTRGQTIGYVGRTGLSTGYHLHFEVRGAANPFRGCSVGNACR